MKILNLTQGSPEWHAHRATARNASEASTALAEGLHTNRAALIERMATGITPEPDRWQQRIFERGHKIESLLMKDFAEKIVGETLAPCVATSDDGYLSASFDGITFMEDVVWECKTANEELRQSIGLGLPLPRHYMLQVQQQMLIANADRALFTAASLDETGEAIDPSTILHCWVEPDRAIMAELLHGWQQFDKDLANWQPTTKAEPAPVGKAPEALPALTIEISGQVTASNLAEFKATALGVIRSVNRDLQTDQDFADAEAAVKWCKKVEASTKAAKERALSQTSSIEELFQALDEISTEARAVRLELDKLTAARSQELKAGKVHAAQTAWRDFTAKLHAELGTACAFEAPDFANAIKGLRSFDSMGEKITAAMLQAQAAAQELAATVRQNKAAMQGTEHLFPDFATVCTMQAEAFEGLVHSRKAKEAEAITLREAAAQAAADKARAEAQEAERQRIEAEAKAKAEQELAQSAPAAAPLFDNPINMASQATAEIAQAKSEPQPDPKDNGHRITLGEVNAHFAPVSITVAGLAQLGFDGEKQGRATLYRHCDLRAMAQAISDHLLKR